MKSDTDQLVSLIHSVKPYHISDLLCTAEGIGFADRMRMLRVVANNRLDLPRGMLFRISEIDEALNRTVVIGIASGKVGGNVIVCIDKTALELERLLYKVKPNLVTSVKSLTFPVVNMPSVTAALTKIKAAYDSHVNRYEYSHHHDFTLLGMIHDYILNDSLTPVLNVPVFD